MKVHVPDELVALGTVVDVTVERNGKREVLEPSEAQWICADEGKETVWLVPKKTVAGKLPKGIDGQLRRLAAVYRMWNDFEPRRSSLTPPIRVEGDWQSLGRVVRLTYRSDKWGDGPQLYEHDCERARMLKLGSLYRITGGVRVTSRGLVG